MTREKRIDKEDQRAEVTVTDKVGVHPFQIGDHIMVKPGRSRLYPELQERHVYTVTEVGENTFPSGAMQSRYWVKIDPPAGNRIVFWGTNLFEAKS